MRTIKPPSCADAPTSATTFPLCWHDIIKSEGIYESIGGGIVVVLRKWDIITTFFITSDTYVIEPCDAIKTASFRNINKQLMLDIV